MKYFVALLLLLDFSVSAFATDLSTLSASRNSEEDYKEARGRSFFLKSLQIPPSATSGTVPSSSAEGVKKPLQNIIITEIPEVSSYSDLEREFIYIRDTRFLATDNPLFPRRLTWMYPDDGCYARAEVVKLELISHRFPAPKKIFAFGNLSSPSSNSPKGVVQWWYHVAVTYRVGLDVYVFDPSIEPKRPLTLNEWNTQVGGDRSLVQYSICDQGTFDPSYDCLSPAPISYEQAYQKQKLFLKYEWDRILELNRDPEKELGPSPPWLAESK